METVHRQSGESGAPDFDHVASRHVASSPAIATLLRAHAVRSDASPDDPAPLFLSDPLGEPDPREFAPRDLRGRSRLAPYVLAVAIAVIAAGLLGALFQSDLRSLIAANAVGATQERVVAAAGPPLAKSAPLKDPARVTGIVLAGADRQEVPAAAAPSREAIATAYQVALQAQAPAPVAVQPPPPAPAAPARTIDPGTLAGLMSRAKSLLAVGDILAARLLLERAANAQDATAAFLLAQSYDPAVLGTSDTRRINADAAVARDWYAKAAALGSVEARQRLAQLQN